MSNEDTARDKNGVVAAQAIIKAHAFVFHAAWQEPDTRCNTPREAQQLLVLLQR
jgi:hypothetical protein